MTSIRDFAGPMGVCGSCGQPCFNGEYGPEHFTEQWDGVFCHMFPLAGDMLRIEWDEASLSDVREKYPDTYPRWSPPGPAVSGATQQEARS